MFKPAMNIAEQRKGIKLNQYNILTDELEDNAGIFPHLTKAKEETTTLKNKIIRLTAEKENSEESFEVDKMIVKALERMLNQYTDEINC